MITYTVWSRGRELGSSTLDFARCFAKMRTGWFYPTSAGTSLMPIITGERDACLAMALAHKRGEMPPASEEDLSKTTIYADLAAAVAHAEALQLELRAPDGRAIPLEDIHIRDVELFIPEIHGNPEDENVSIDDLSEADRACVEELVAAMEELDEPAPWEPEPEFGRFQLYVTLRNEWDIP